MSLEDDCTVLVGLDKEHWPEFCWSFRTWERNWPECLEMEWRFVVDDTYMRPDEWLMEIEHCCPAIEFSVTWYPRRVESQRHHMLSGLVKAASELSTTWFVKIDTDTQRVKTPVCWWDEDWLRGDKQFVTHRWGYTKSIAMWRRLEDWGSFVSQFVRPAYGMELPGKDRVSHRRIISFWMLCRTEFARTAWDMVDGDVLPIPSQDTFYWYVAERMGLEYVAGNMKNRGWTHGRRVEERAKEILNG